MTTPPRDTERRFPRFEAEHTAVVRTIDDNAEELARTRSMGIGGCGVVLPQALPAGVAVELLLSVDHQVLQLFGKTVYCRPIGEGRVEVGLEFLEVMEDDAALLESVLAAAAS